MDLYFYLVLLSLLHSQLGSARRNKFIVPGAEWRDTDGNVLSAHAGGITYFDGRWYWFGQNERPDRPELFAGLNVYSSPDLLNWDFDGFALEAINGTDIGPGTVVERPKVIYSHELGQWVLWFHSDNSTYGLLRQGTALSPNINGPYEFQEVFNPLGGTSQDFGLFQDDDGVAYALYSNGDADEAHDNLITRLTPDFTNVEEVIYTFYDFDLEAPFILKSDQRYYILMSHKTGYRPNNVVVFSAESLSGPWSVQSYIAPLGGRTYNSQSTIGIKVSGSGTTTYIYCGDQWATARDLYESAYVWLPATINDSIGSFRIDWHDLWAIDVETGNVYYPEGTSYEAEDGVTSGSAYPTLCPTCSGTRIVTGLEGNASITVTSIAGTGQPQWVSLYYHNPDGLFGDNRGGTNLVLERWAGLSINGADPVRIRQRVTNAGIVLGQTFNVTFNEGGNNTLTISGWDGSKASDLDKIVVYGNIYDD